MCQIMRHIVLCAIPNIVLESHIVRADRDHCRWHGFLVLLPSQENVVMLCVSLGLNSSGCFLQFKCSCWTLLCIILLHLRGVLGCSLRGGPVCCQEE